MHAELSGQPVLFGLVSVVAGGVQCVLLGTTVALLERADEVTAQDVRLSSLRQGGKPIRKPCRVGCLLSKSMPDCLVFCEQDARFTPFNSDLLPQGNSLTAAQDFSGGTITPTDPPGLRQQQQLHPTPSALAVDSVLETLISTAGKLATGLEALEDDRGAPDTAPGELGGAVRRTPFLQTGFAVWKVPRASVGVVPEAAHLPSATNVDSSVPLGAERGPSSAPESNVGAALGAALTTLLQRAIRQPDSGYEVSAAPASSLECSRLRAAQLERLKLTRESNPSLVIRATSAKFSGTLACCLESRGLNTGMLETRFCWRR